MFKGSLFKKTGLAWTILGIGLLATLFISLQVKQGIDQAAVRQFAFTCDQVTLKIQERLGAYALILRGGSALFAASVSVERKEWQAYADRLQSEQNFPGIQGFGFAQMIPADQLVSHIAKIRKEGFPDYTISPIGKRDIYTSVIYLEPFRDRNLRAFGYDMYTEPVRRAAMEQARDTGIATLSGKVELVQETGTDVQAGVLMYAPVYRNGAPVNTALQRRTALFGWVYSPYRMNDLMNGILADWERHEGKTVDLTIYDGREATLASLLFDNQPAIASDDHSLFYQQRTIDFKDHQWLLVLDRNGTLSVINYLPAWAVLGGGFALSGLLFGLMRSMTNTQATAVRIAEGLTAEIRQGQKLLNQSQKKIHLLLNSTAEAIYGIDTNGDCTFCNNACLHLLGYQHPDDLLGKNMHWQIHGKYADGTRFPVEDCRIFQAYRKGERMHVDDEVLWRSDGSSFPAEYWSYPESESGVIVGAVVSFVDITERKEVQKALDLQMQLQQQAKEALRINNEEQRAIFDSVTSGIALIKEGFILRCNRKLEELFGYASGELDGQSTRLWYPDEAAYQADSHFVYQEISNGKFYHIERQLICKDGRLFWARLSGQALESEDPALAVVEIIDNITFEHEAADALLKAKEMAEDATRTKSEFLANMSHEIRTPMNGVLGMLDLLRETEMTPTQLDWLETAHSSGEILLAIINDILDLSKLEAGKVEIEQVNFNLVDLVDDVCAAMAGQAHAKGLALNCLLPADLFLRWRGDPLRIRQVLTNLIGNAVKFTDQGEISVSVSQTPLSDSRDELRFEVHDTGIGISPATQLTLFKSFTQADSTTSRSFGGSGLGLFISKKLVELMGGTIDVNSVQGVGSCFWFTLPLAQSESIEITESFYDLAGKRTLIVDDNATNRNILSTYLSRWGLEVSAFDNGSAALMQLQTSALQGVIYDLIVMDMQMPTMDGLTLAKYLAEIPALAKIPIILLSSGDQLKLADYQNTGIIQHLLKPARQVQLFDAIVNALQGGSRPDQKPALTERQWPDYKDKKVLVVEDNKVNQKVIIAKLSKYGIVPDLSENGQLALAMLAQHTYDLILMDCQMPVMDGYVATRELRLLEARLGLPRQTVVAFTANALKGEREKCLAAGMDDYLGKPIVAEQLAAILAGRLGSRPTATASALNVEINANMSIWNATAALENLNGDNALLDEVITLFLTEAPKQLNELTTAQAEGNLPALANAAQAIKGAVAEFYAEPVKECALLLEQTARKGQSADYQSMIDDLVNKVTNLIRNLRLAKTSNQYFGHF